MKKINFNAVLKDAFGKEVMEKRASGAEEKEVPAVPVRIDVSLVNIIAHPASIPEGATLTGMQVLERFNLQQKIASGTEQEYSPEELTLIREIVTSLFNKKMLGIELAGTIYKMAE